MRGTEETMKPKRNLTRLEKKDAATINRKGKMETTKSSSSSVAFWAKDPTALLQQQHLLEMWPTMNMCYEQKLNAVTRLVLVITLVGYFVSRSLKTLLVGGITLVLIVLLYQWRRKNKKSEEEGFAVIEPLSTALQDTYLNPATLQTALKSEFQLGTKKNPFSNVLLTEIGDNPTRQAAPPAFNVDVDEDITKNVKRAVQQMNPTIKNTNKQLFGDLWQNFQLDQSNRVFYSTANTRVSNDQTAFAKFLYGTMPSAKESTPEGAFARVQDNYRYTLY